jgi:hypothetical protein
MSKEKEVKKGNKVSKKQPLKKKITRSLKKTKSQTETPSRKNTSRPWQGTILAILSVLSLIITIMFLPFTILMALAGGALSFVENLGPIFGVLLGGGGAILTIMLIIYLIVGIFITKGLFKGKKWTIILLFIFSLIGLPLAIFDFTLLSLIITAIFIYLEVSCLQHPFYNKKK